MVEENNTFALGMLKERGRVAPIVYIKFVILGIYYFFFYKKWIHFMLFILHSKILYVLCGREVTTARRHWQGGHLPFLASAKGKMLLQIIDSIAKRFAWGYRW
jgi:hypothetical protein